MKTLEQKMEWIRNATNEQLVNQFKSMMRFGDVMEYANRFGIDINEAYAEYEAIEKEIMERMSSKEDKAVMKPRNWIEEALGKQISLNPVYVGNKGGRKIYAIRFEDGSEGDYFIDFLRKLIEEY